MQSTFPMKKEPAIQSRFYRKFSSSIKSITIHLANFRFNHKDNPSKEDIYIGRELLENKLESWLLSSDESGSYLIAGYRGMGKTSLVNHVLNRITRQRQFQYECIFRISAIGLILTILFLWGRFYKWSSISGLLFFAGAFIMIRNQSYYTRYIKTAIDQFRNNTGFSKQKLKKLLAYHDFHQKSYHRIRIKVNLGKEVMNERDVLCLITNQIRMQYETFLRMGQNKPGWVYLRILFCGMVACLAVNKFIRPLYEHLQWGSGGAREKFFIEKIWNGFFLAIRELNNEKIYHAIFCMLLFIICYFSTQFLLKKFLSLFDHSEQCLKQLQTLSIRLSSATREADGNIPNLVGSLINISFSNQKHKETPIANVRDIETELTEIINRLNSKECFRHNQAQFLIVLDELDKIDYRPESDNDKNTSEPTPPDFSTAIDGFSGSVTNNERRRSILQLLANMKLFLTSAHAKFIFISGRELYEAFLADLSDREYAISSIFSGVINVNSFLHPEREQSDISSLTEQYVAEILLPRNYLWEKTKENARKNKVLKREIPSLRWYTQYLTEIAEKECSGEELELRKTEIRHVIMFLRCFIVYLSHVSNGSPKKIVLYFEKYIKRSTDCLKLTEWGDSLEYGVKSQYALHFTPQDQQKIGFIFYLASPIMDAITNNVSDYDDKLLIAASFLVDHLFKFHGRGFSWHNIEQTPELLDVNKTPELRDFITSIIEFMRQTHLSSIMVGLFQFKFRKRISEEISYISRTSDEAAAIFNFTLNETQAIKRHYVKLLNYYMTLSAQTSNNRELRMYDDVITNLHLTLGDLYFQEEDYSRTLQEYRSALDFLDRNQQQRPNDSSLIVSRIRCMLKMGLTCEYCKTYETAYIIYCNLIDKMISAREVAERDLGLDIVDTWTNDWRIKQPMVIDPGVRAKDNEIRQEMLEITPEQYAHYRGQIINGMWDDNTPKKKDLSTYVRSLHSAYAPAEYSLDFERLVSGFAKNLSPEKSHFIANLSMFEDVKLIYKAILAKLFILEKMNMNGITQSNIEIAEAEFKYLHRTVNIHEKFFVSADFFNQLGKILYYKNSLGLLPGMSDDSKKETLRVALYWWNVDLYAYLDDFCFKVCNSRLLDSQRKDAVSVKREIREFFEWFTIDKINTQNWESMSRSRIIIMLKNDINNSSKDSSKQFNKKIISEYTNYITSRIHKQKSVLLFPKIIDCSQHRCDVRKKAWNLPCHACKYYNESLRILTQEMFVDWNEKEQERFSVRSQAVYLLWLSFRRRLRYARTNHLRLLATNIASMGNTMYSCTSDLSISYQTLKFTHNILGHGKDADKQKEIQDFATLNQKLSKLDKAILYYLGAYRYYSIASQPKDAGECLFRILRLLNETITVINFDKKTTYEQEKKIEERLRKEKRKSDSEIHLLSWASLLIDGKTSLLESIFTRYAKAVNEQYGYNALPELYDYRWLFHMNAHEDLDMARLKTYSELKEMIWLIADTRIKLLNFLSYRVNTSGPTPCAAKYKELSRKRRDEIIRAYNHFCPLGKNRDTFYNEVITNYARFRLNKLILKDLFHKDPLVDPQNSHRYNNQFIVQFLECLENYLREEAETDRLDVQIFKIDGTRSDKMQLIEFLLEDSIVCLTEIIYILTPYNHISSFTNSFVAEVYAQLWEQSKMYEILIMLYDYHQYHNNQANIHELFNLWNIDDKRGDIKDAVINCNRYIEDNSNLQERYGALSSRFFMHIRHKIDDRTLHHVISNYAAEMALRYYRLAEISHSEGTSYQNQVERNYILNDDLDNDTWLFNTTVERFRLHSEYIQNHRRRLVDHYNDSRIYSYKRSYIFAQDSERAFAQIFDGIRFDDSLHTNSEL